MFLKTYWSALICSKLCTRGKKDVKWTVAVCRSTEEMVYVGRGAPAVVQTSANNVRLPGLAAEACAREACFSERRPTAGATELNHAACPDHITILTTRLPHLLSRCAAVPPTLNIGHRLSWLQLLCFFSGDALFSLHHWCIIDQQVLNIP